MTAPCTQTERLLVAAVVSELWKQHDERWDKEGGPFVFGESLPEDGTIGINGRMNVLGVVRAVLARLGLPSQGEEDTVPMNEDETRRWAVGDPEPAPEEIQGGLLRGRCTRCGSASGDSWSHCEGGPCPVPASPHYRG